MVYLVFAAPLILPSGSAAAASAASEGKSRNRAEDLLTEVLTSLMGCSFGPLLTASRFFFSRERPVPNRAESVGKLQFLSPFLFILLLICQVLIHQRSECSTRQRCKY